MILTALLLTRDKYSSWRVGRVVPMISTFSPDLFGMGMMVEHLKHEGTSHSSSDLLKIFVKMGAS